MWAPKKTQHRRHTNTHTPSPHVRLEFVLDERGLREVCTRSSRATSPHPTLSLTIDASHTFWGAIKGSRGEGAYTGVDEPQPWRAYTRARITRRCGGRVDVNKRKTRKEKETNVTPVNAPSLPLSLVA